MSAYNVYAAFDKNGECLYIGSGASERYKHVNSGHSHVYDLNRLHFSGVRLDVKIIKEFESKAEALAHEIDMIKLKSPKFNKTFNTGKNRTVLSSEIHTKIDVFLCQKGVPNRSRAFCRRTVQELSEFIKPITLFKEVWIPRLKDTSKERSIYDALRRSLRGPERDTVGSNRHTLSYILKSESPNSCIFTDEFKEFCYNDV